MMSLQQTEPDLSYETKWLGPQKPLSVGLKIPSETVALRLWLGDSYNGGCWLFHVLEGHILGPIWGTIASRVGGDAFSIGVHPNSILRLLIANESIWNNAQKIFAAGIIA